MVKITKIKQKCSLSPPERNLQITESEKRWEPRQLGLLRGDRLLCALRMPGIKAKELISNPSDAISTPTFYILTSCPCHSSYRHPLP